MSTEPEPGDQDRAGKGARYRVARPKRTGWRRFVNWKTFWFSVLGLFLLGAAGIGVAFAVIDVPEPNDFSTSEATIVYFDDGTTELGRFSAENREIVDAETIPETLKQAVVAAEDRGFYENAGFSVTGMARAAWDSLRGSPSAGGGSTITQQYVKNYYLTQDRSYTRKLRELVISVKVDQEADKEQILADYLNTIWFGRSTYGVQTASKAYFGVDVAELDLARSAALAAILRSPSRYDPTLGPENAERFAQRFRYVLDGMVTTGALDQATADATQPPEILPERQVNRYGGTNGYLLMMVRNELLALGYDELEIETGGLRVRTSFNDQAQAAAYDAVTEERPTENADGVRVGLASVRPNDGAVLAVYGGPDAVSQSFNDAVNAVPQAGSAVKPFTLAAALENGYSLDSRFYGNSPFDPPELGPPVSNQDDEDYGRNVTLERAMENSVNTAFVDLTMELGSQTVVDSLIRAGFPDDEQLQVNPRVTIGIGGVSALNMANAYATLAAQGMHADPYIVAEVTDRDDVVDYQHAPTAERAFEEDVMADVTYSLTETVDNGTASAAQELGRPAAAKTGTHDDKTAWFAGYTPQMATAVVYFRGDGTDSLNGVGGMDHFSGGAYPGRTWTTFMGYALDGQPTEEFPEPANLEGDDDYDYDFDYGGGGGGGGGGGDDDGDDRGDDGESGDEDGDGAESGDGGDESGADDGESGEGDQDGAESGAEGGDGTDAGADAGEADGGGDQSGTDGGTDAGADAGADAGGDQSGGAESGGDQSGGAESGDADGGAESGGDQSGADADGTEGADTGAEPGAESGAEAGEWGGTETSRAAALFGAAALAGGLSGSRTRSPRGPSSNRAPRSGPRRGRRP